MYIFFLQEMKHMEGGFQGGRRALVLEAYVLMAVVKCADALVVDDLWGVLVVRMLFNLPTPCHFFAITT